MASLAVVFLLIAVAFILITNITENPDAKNWAKVRDQQAQIMQKKSSLLNEIKTILKIETDDTNKQFENACYVIKDEQNKIRVQVFF